MTDLDLTSHDTFLPGVPYEWFAEKRRTEPVFWHEGNDEVGRGFWNVLKHADIGPVSKEYTRFSSERGLTYMWDLPEEQLLQQRMMMLNMDPPNHTKLRLLVQRGFTPRHIAMLEQHVRDLAVRIVDEALEMGEGDFVSTVAAELPLQVIAEMLGVPHEDRRKLFDWSNRMVGSHDPEFAVTEEDSRAASLELFAYANELAAERRVKPADDIVTALLTAEVDGEHLSDLEFDLFVMLLAVAGNETTRNLLTHAMIALFEHPDQWRMLVEDRSLLPRAVEEFLRWGTPVMHFRRTAIQDVEIRGKQIKEGDKVVLWYSSANRDEEVFDDPMRFDITRNPNPHVAFGGGGPHFCLGANLARLEIRAMFDEILRRIPKIEQAGPAERLRSNFINGIKHLPVRYVA